MTMHVSAIRLWQAAEKVRQRRSRLERILNVARGYASGAFIGCGLADGLFEQPAGKLTYLMAVSTFVRGLSRLFG